MNTIPFKISMMLLLVISIVCAVTIQLEYVRYAFTTLAFLLMGIYNTVEYKSDKQKSSLYFSMMFYCFSLSALVFAVISKLVG